MTFKHIKTRQGFIDRAIEYHGDFYDYSKVTFTPRPPGLTFAGNRTRQLPEYNREEKVIIICPYHGEFLQRARRHIEKDPSGCQKCAIEKISGVIREKFADPTVRNAIEEAYKIKLFNKWDGRITVENYVNQSLIADFYCKDCDYHWRTNGSNVIRYGCQSCDTGPSGQTRKRRSHEEYLKDLEKSGNAQLIPVEDYRGAATKIKHFCEDCEQILEIFPSNLLRGQGCGSCAKKRYVTESLVREAMEDFFGHKFPNTRPDFLKNPDTGYNLELDGYCEELQIAFEYNGLQHYEEIPFYKKSFKTAQGNDKIKARKCKEKGVVLWVFDSREFGRRPIHTLKKLFAEDVEKRFASDLEGGKL
jgi:hypothetical protein